MAIWLVRAGKSGAHENYALENKVAVIGWADAGNLSDVATKPDLLVRLEQSFPENKHKTLLNWQSQVWPFLREIKVGDIVAMPMKHRPTVAFGKVTGSYKYVEDAPWDAKNQLPVDWNKEIPRSEISQD